MTPPNVLGAPRYRRKWNPRIAAQQRKEREANQSRDKGSWDELSKSEMQNYEGIGNGKRQETLQRLKFRYNYQFIFCDYCFFSISKTWQMPKRKTVHATKTLSVPHFFHGQSSPPETLAQCAEATFFFSGETVIWNSPNFWSRWRTKRNTRDASMMVKLLGLMFFFFFRFCWMIELGSCTRLPSLEATAAKAGKKWWKGSYDESISLSILIKIWCFRLLKLRDPKDCFVMLHCHVWWCMIVKVVPTDPKAHPKSQPFHQVPKQPELVEREAAWSRPKLVVLGWLGGFGKFAMTSCISVQENCWEHHEK